MSRHSSKDRKWTEKIRPIVLDLYDYQCVLCGSTEDLTVDHIIPKSKGGTDDIENLRVLCRPHNSQKGASFGPVVREWFNPRWF